MNNKFINKLSYRKYEKQNKRYKRIAAAIVISLGIVGYAQYEASRGIELVYGDKKIGVVKEKEEAIELVDEFEKNLSEKYNKDIKLEEGVSFNKTNLRKESLTDKSDLAENLERNATYCAVGYAIEVDGKDVAYLNNRESAVKVIEEYKDSFSSTDSQIETKSVDILEDVSIVKKEVEVEKIEDIEGTVEQLKSKENEEAPVLTVETSEQQIASRETDFEEVVELDDSLFQNEETVVVEGERGLVEEQSEVKKVNGVESERRVVVETIKKQPVDRVVIRGTKEVPTTVPSGVFNSPLQGRLTSQFGQRWGRAHAGIDIGAGAGEAIQASDGGVVTYAQFNSGGYGNLVEISHENGFTTRYAHASEIFVTPGQRVAKGEIIAAVGSTGRSTGPHLHFEIRQNDVPQNPLELLQ